MRPLIGLSLVGREDRRAFLATKIGQLAVELQQGPQAAELNLSSIAELDPEGGPIERTAAIVSQLDLVITVDTMMAHLAGALGRPVWVALKTPAEWRWLETRGDSPWYPTMRLFRQGSPGDWQGVFEEIRLALVATLARRAAT